MPTLENDRIVFRFPKIEERARLEIGFNRTLRVPDDGKTYPLPSSTGQFMLRHAEDFVDRLSVDTVDRGGVILPMWQTEALWIKFDSQRVEWNLDFPIAVKIAAGKINAINGERWQRGLSNSRQDYIVVPPQPWLDGFAVEKGVVRQFVAMPLGKGATFEEQITGAPEWGGIQIFAAPLKPEVWKTKRHEWEKVEEIRRRQPDSGIRYSIGEKKIGLTGGGTIRQEIYVDPFGADDWDMEAAQRVFVSIVHAKDWFKITGENNPNKPFTMESYAAAKLPWFEYCDVDQATLPGALSLANLKSIATYVKEGARSFMPGVREFRPPRPVKLGPKGIEADLIQTSSEWDR